MYQNLLYYKFVEIADPEAFKDEHKALCERVHLKGKVLISREGLNGCVSGERLDTETYMQIMHRDERFKDMDFKVGECEEHTFAKLVVRTRPEIITFEKDVDLSNPAPYISSKELKELLDKGEDIVLIDGRNKYEADFGTFKGAIVPDIETFKTFPQEVKKWEHLKKKTIVTFCTGGIRCEKAATYMQEQGFENVYQLHGGILTYGKECGSAHWNGECFVFDKRVAVDMDAVEELHEVREDAEFCCVAPFKKALGKTESS